MKRNTRFFSHVLKYKNSHVPLLIFFILFQVCLLNLFFKLVACKYSSHDLFYYRSHRDNVFVITWHVTNDPILSCILSLTSNLNSVLWVTRCISDCLVGVTIETCLFTTCSKAPHYQIGLRSCRVPAEYRHALFKSSRINFYKSFVFWSLIRFDYILTSFPVILIKYEFAWCLSHIIYMI